MHRVLVVDDDSGLRLVVTGALGQAHYLVDQAVDGEDALNKVRAGNYDLVLLDVNMPRLNGIEALKQIKSYDPSIIVIMLTAYSNVRDAIEATKHGAFNYLEKPIMAENLVLLVDRALKAHSMVKTLSYSAPVVKIMGSTNFVGQSSEIKKIFNVIDKLSRVDTSVLIRGESGTGKELVANAIHYNSPRKDERFVTVNCSAIPETLIESEFFGHEKGAFTGADSRKIGKFQFADGGTLFLDEIGDISLAMQVKLLRALQEKKFTPVGSNREVEVNVRIIAATNRPLEAMIKKGDFREDLFYRLNVIPIFLPPLRERTDDIEVLVTHFIEKFNAAHQKAIEGTSAEAAQYLKEYHWPGNIRELENVIEHAFVIEPTNQITTLSLPESVIDYVNHKREQAQPQKTVNDSNAGLKAPSDITEEHLELRHHSEVEANEEDDESLDDLDIWGLTDDGKEHMISPEIITMPIAGQKLGFTLDISKLDFQANKEEFERQFLISALKAFSGRINQTALHANIPKKTLLRKLEKYGINAKDYQNQKSSGA